jgi:transketolase
MSEISQREAYGRALAAYGAVNQRVVALDADTSSSTLSHFFASKFPDRFFNIGIAEPCMVDVAAGLALGGLVPFVNGFAALLALRAVEAIRTNLCYARTNVKLAASYAGVSDFKDGPTHHSITDVAFMRSLPGMTVIVPADAAEVAAWVPVIGEMDGPVYLRLNRSATVPVYTKDVSVEVGKGNLLREGRDLTFIAMGSLLGRCLQASDILASLGIYARVIGMASVKPLDEALVLQAAADTGAIVTAEEHSILGGLGGAVAELLSETLPTPIKRMGIRDRFALTAPDPEALMDALGLSVQDLVSTAVSLVEKKPSFRQLQPVSGAEPG